MRNWLMVVVFICKMNRRVSISQDKDTGLFWSMVHHDKDKWENGPFETIEKAVESYNRRLGIIQKTKKSKGTFDSWAAVGDSRWIAYDTTKEFGTIQEQLMKESSNMFISHDDAQKPYSGLIGCLWASKFDSNESKEAYEELRTKTKSGSFFLGVPFKDNHWIFEVEHGPYKFTSGPYESMFIAWIERELLLIHIGMENKSDMKKADKKDRELMNKLYNLTKVPKYEGCSYFSDLHSERDPRITLTSTV